MKYKFYEFKHVDGREIVVAESGSQAVDYFVNNYLCDVEDMFSDPGFNVKRLELDEITEKREIFNEDENTSEVKSYFDLAVETSDQTLPRVIVCPNY